MIKPVRCKTIEDLKSFLEEKNVWDKTNWNHETLSQLWSDLRRGAYTLAQRDSEAVLIATRVALDVFDIVSPSLTHRLKEVKIIKGPNKGPRHTEFTFTDKLQKGEKPFHAAERCLKNLQMQLKTSKKEALCACKGVEANPSESLQEAVTRLRRNRELRNAFLLFKTAPVDVEDGLEEKYSGLPVIRRNRKFVCFIPLSFRRLDGYRFGHAGRTARYEWSIHREVVAQYDTRKLMMSTVE